MLVLFHRNWYTNGTNYIIGGNFMENENNNEIMNVQSTEMVVNESENNNKIKIADEVVAIIAGKAVSEIKGVYEMSGGFAGGISEVLSGKKNLKKGIKVVSTEKNTKIEFIYVKKLDLKTKRKAQRRLSEHCNTLFA